MASDSQKTTRVMPSPWFTANNTTYCIAEFARSGREPLRIAEEGERQLGPFVLPPFQRPPVWTLDQQIRLIESLWAGLPIGAYVFNQTEFACATDAWLLDGQQRITAILAYVAGSFPVLGYRFAEISKPEQRHFMMKPVGTLITRLTDPDACRDVYNRLAYGGTSHKLENAR